MSYAAAGAVEQPHSFPCETTEARTESQKRCANDDETVTCLGCSEGDLRGQEMGCGMKEIVLLM